MNNESLEPLEQRLRGAHSPAAPAQLRASVMRDVHRELRASRWERRVTRVAAALFVMGVAMNVVISIRTHRPVPALATTQPRESLTEVAVTVAETTDAQAGRQFARRLAALAGWSFGGEEAAAIDAAVNKSLGRNNRNGNGKDG